MTWFLLWTLTLWYFIGWSHLKEMMVCTYLRWQGFCLLWQKYCTLFLLLGGLSLRQTSVDSDALPRATLRCQMSISSPQVSSQPTPLLRTSNLLSSSLIESNYLPTWVPWASLFQTPCRPLQKVSIRIAALLGTSQLPKYFGTHWATGLHYSHLLFYVWSIKTPMTSSLLLYYHEWVPNQIKIETLPFIELSNKPFLARAMVSILFDLSTKHPAMYLTGSQPPQPA